MNRRLSGVLALALALAGCASPEGLAPRATPAEPSSLQVGKTFSGARLASGSWPADDWWTTLGDPQLDRLIGDALAGSPSIRLARARVERARSLALAAGSPLAPQAAASANATRQRFPEHFIYPPPFAGTWHWQNQARLDLSYDFDFWGRNRAAWAAALGEQKAAEADAYAARLALAAAIARTYVGLAQAYERLDLAHQTLAQRRKVLALVRERVAAGIDSQLELKQAETGIPEANEAIARIEADIALARNALAALAGAGPDRGLALERPKLTAPEALLPSRLPAQLLGRRPDVVASRWRAEAAARNIDAARARFYPNINLAAFVGLQSLDWPKFLDAGSTLAGFGPALSLPVFDGGTLRGNLGARDAEYDAAVEQYNQTLADALREVADQLAALRAVERERPHVREGLATAEQAYQLAVARYRAGLAGLLSVLNAESQVIAQRSLAADLRARELDAAIGLARALGGGYNEKGSSHG